jgi:hypothetical protein
MMKKYFNYALASAIVLLSTNFITACSSSDDVAVENNPTYNSVDNTVTAQFVLNVSSAENAMTRQSSATVQRNSNFRGIQDARLIGLSTGKSTWLAPFAGSSTGYGVKKTYDLGTLYGPTAVTASENESSSSRRVLELSMPLTMDAMLVYGRAIPATYTTDVDPDAANGKVNMNIDATPENTTISLVPRLSSTRTDEYNQTCALAVKILNRIVDSQVGGEDANARTINGYTNKAALPALTWKQLGTATGELSHMEEVLASAFKNLTTINPGEYRAGSSSAISSIAFYVYNIAKSVYSNTATNDNDLNAQLLAYEIMRRIENYFEKYDNASYTEAQTAFLDLSVIKNHMLEAIKTMTDVEFDNAYGKVKHGDLKAFPTSFNLPLGVALLTYSSTNGFSHINSSTLPSLLDKNAVLAEDRYMYPSELLYFDNSALRVNKASVVASSYPNGVTPWETDANWTGWTNGAVTSTTRSVAVKNNINYGVAMLQTKVILDTSIGDNFEDNRNEIVSTEANQKLTANEVKQFQLVGVLVGGQHHQMGWNYLAQNTTSDDWSYVVYDNQITSGTVPTPNGEENYTLVFDNYIPQATQTSDVYVALEFKNNGRDFYGVGNMIRSGGTFYLVGKLTLANATNTATFAWPAKYAIPPYTDAGASQEIKRIFIQDYMTTATFKIGQYSLQNAFVTVPDLRSSQTSLGLSVDLQWQTGLNFEAILGQ